MEKVVALRAGNRIALDPHPTPPEVVALLAPHLSYTEKIMLRGKDAYVARKQNRALFHERYVECFGEDHKGRLTTAYGFYQRIHDTLTAAGYEVSIDNLTRHPRPEVYEPEWDRIADEEIRYRQREALEMIVQHDCGRIDCPPAYGKSQVIRLACQLFPKARIAVVTRSGAVLTQRLYPELATNLPSVGIVGLGHKVKGRRVMCYTSASMHHAIRDEDFVFVDEGHEAASDDAAQKLAQFDRSRMWAFSGTFDMRYDGKAIRQEAIFGPVRMKVTFQEAEQHGVVTPVVVLWSNVTADEDICADVTDPVERKRVGLWSHGARNRIIAHDAQSYGPDVQVLVACETIEHVLYLKRLLPEFTVVHHEEGIQPSDLRYFRKLGLLDNTYRPLTWEKRQRITRDFTAGRLKKVIVNTVWNVGVDFPRLQVLVRADGGSSRERDTQIPGRTVRIFEGKSVAILHDYLDQFNSGFAVRATGRRRSYEANGWQQEFPGNRSRLGKELGWK